MAYFYRMDQHTLLDILEQPARWASLNANSLALLHKQYPYFHALGNVVYVGSKKHEDLPVWSHDVFTQARLSALANRTQPITLTANVPEEPATTVNPTKESDDILQLINRIPLHAEITLDTLPVVAHMAEPEPEPEPTPDLSEKSLMVMMSFSDWMNYYKVKQMKEKEEAESKKALNASWQKEKLAAAIEEDIDDEVPEPIFKQAMDSISTESGVISESLAKLLAEQGKTDRAIAMYKKLSLRNPEKSSYFARLIEQLNSK